MISSRMLGPAEWERVGIGFVEEAIDGCLERGEGVEHEAWVPLQPSYDLTMLVGGVVVEDDLHDLLSGHLGLGAVPNLVVGHGAAAALLQQQPGLGTVERLNVALLVHRQHNGMACCAMACLRPVRKACRKGGPLCPLLANLVLVQLDRELERRGHRFVPYTDDFNIYVRSEKAGQRATASVTRMPGGVGGAASRDTPLPRSTAADSAEAHWARPSVVP
jgi:Reverse transcriptase (RNA-dependent DNA polymerase)